MGEASFEAAKELRRNLHALRDHVDSNRARVGEEDASNPVLDQRRDVEGVEQQEEGLGLRLGEDTTPHDRVFVVLWPRRRGRVAVGGPGGWRRARLEQRLHSSGPITGGGTPKHGGVQMGEEKADASVETGGGVWRGGGGEEATHEAQRLSTVAGGSK